MGKEWLWLLGSYSAGFCLWLFIYTMVPAEEYDALGRLTAHPAAGIFFAFTLGITLVVYLFRGIWWMIKQKGRRAMD